MNEILKAKLMTNSQLLELLLTSIKSYRKNAVESVNRNSHMNDLDGKFNLSQNETDALLVDFANYVAYNMGIDYGLKTEDLKKHPD